jgi:hypothetical protein
LNRAYKFKNSFCVPYPAIDQTLDRLSSLSSLGRVFSRHIVYRISPSPSCQCCKNCNKTGRPWPGITERIRGHGRVLHSWDSKLVTCWDRRRVWKEKFSLQTNNDHDDKGTCAPVLTVLDTRSAKNVAEFWVGKTGVMPC